MAKSGDIFSVNDLSDGDLDRLFCATRNAKAHGFDNRFSNKILLTAFFEPSTRTRLSFEMAAHRLGLKVLSFDQSFSSMKKGEGFLETMANLLAMKPDICVVRCGQRLEPKMFDNESPMINGGDGVNEHPSQALLDCFTLLEHFGTDDLFKKKILIIGDVAHSRVAHSNIKLLKRLSAEVILLAPQALRLRHDLGQDLEVSSFSAVPGEISAVMCLRLQKERLIGGLSSDLDLTDFCLTMPRLLRLGTKSLVLHPGPMNLGEEITKEVALCPKSLIYRQVENGVFVRAMLINHCLS